MHQNRRRFPIGAELHASGRVHFRVWAPKSPRVDVVFERRTSALTLADGRDCPLFRSPDGYHEGECAASAGDRYRFRLDGGGELFPDPASRFQPDGPHGPSEIVDAHGFDWTDQGWRGITGTPVVVYEMHIGTFTREGTWRAAAERMPRLAALGITVLEVMPIADFPGEFGWGYDGVNLFAPSRLYGRPDDLRAFVDRAHALGLGVILDVVYNHLGPAGNWLDRFSDDYFGPTDTEWGRAPNFDGAGATDVRAFYLSNAAYWIEEFHFDGLRLDATQSIVDRSPDHLVAAIVRRVRDAARGRATWIVAEHERQEAKMVRGTDEGGFGLDALWNDDFHHSAMVALTGHREAYYTDYFGHPQEFVSAAKHGFLYQGQWYRWQKQPRGTAALDIGPPKFVAFLENHDQVANSAQGARLHQRTSPGRYRAMTALTLLGPWTPMLFQGQEFGSTAPFLYFADHEPELAKAVNAGRAEFLKQFPRLARPEMLERIPDAGDPATFARCKLDDHERERDGGIAALHADLLRLRRSDPTVAAQGAHGVDGAVLGSHAFVLRLFGDSAAGTDRLILVNLGSDLSLAVVPEPLLAPPSLHRWDLRWSSEAPEYGGAGIVSVETNPGWHLPGESAVLLAAVPAEEGDLVP